MIIVGSIAVYVLLSQLAQVNLVDLFRNAKWEWLLVALVASIMTYPGAAWSLTGFVPEKLKLIRTVAAQLAGDFATLVAPPTLGAVAIISRYVIPAFENTNTPVMVGLVFMLAGLFTATKWR